MPIKNLNYEGLSTDVYVHKKNERQQRKPGCVTDFMGKITKKKGSTRSSEYPNTKIWRRKIQ